MNGSLPNLPAGYVTLDFTTVPPVVGDLDGDGSVDTAVVVGCSKGGVNWPDNILVYRPDRSLLGMIDLSAVSPAEHSGVGTMAIDAGEMKVSWTSYSGCCFDKKDWTGSFRWNGSTFETQEAVGTADASAPTAGSATDAAAAFLSAWRARDAGQMAALTDAGNARSGRKIPGDLLAFTPVESVSDCDVDSAEFDQAFSCYVSASSDVGGNTYDLYFKWVFVAGAGWRVVSFAPDADAADTEVDGSASTDGDLGLAQPIQNLPCGGQFIVLAASSVNASSYASDIGAGLGQFTGSNYLLTSGSCASLTQKSDSGSDIYAVYLGPYTSKDEACAHATRGEVRFLNGDSPTAATLTC